MSRVINSRNQKVLVQNLEVASSFFSRLMGLMGRPSFSEGQGLLLKNSGNSIHTCFMKFPIDTAFITSSGEVKFTQTNLKPWRMVIAKTLALTDCLELPAGTLQKTETRVGDILRVED